MTDDSYPPVRPSAGARRDPRPSRFAAIVTAVVEATLEKRDVSVIGSKTAGPAVSNVMSLLPELFPDVRHLLAIRNPLDAINSMMNRRNLARRGLDPWPMRDVSEGVAEFRRGVLTLLSHVARTPDRAFVVPYEDVLAGYDATVAGVGSFVGLSLPAAPGSRVLVDRPLSRTVLTPDEDEVVRTSFPGAIAMWDEKELRGTHLDGRIDDLADCLEGIVPGRRYLYGGDAPTRSFLGVGWSISQQEGVWSDGARAELFFPAPRSRRYQMLIEGSFFLPDRDAKVTIAVEHAGREIFRGTCVLGSEMVSADETSRLFAGPGPRTLLTLPFEPEGLVTHVALHIEGASSPKAAGFSGDDRLLGFLLQSMTLRDVRTRAPARGAGVGVRARHDALGSTWLGAVLGAHEEATHLANSFGRFWSAAAGSAGCARRTVARNARCCTASMRSRSTTRTRSSRSARAAASSSIRPSAWIGLPASSRARSRRPARPPAAASGRVRRIAGAAATRPHRRRAARAVGDGERGHRRLHRARAAAHGDGDLRRARG